MFPTCSLLGSVLLLNAVSWDGPLSLKYIKSELGWLIPSHIADKASLILSYRGPRQAHLSAAAGQATCWPQFSSICSLCFLSASQAAPSVPRDSCLRGSLPGATAEESRGPSQHSTPPHPVLHRPVFSSPPSETNRSSQCCLPGALQSGKLQPGQSQFPPQGMWVPELKPQEQTEVWTGLHYWTQSPVAASKLLSSCLLQPISPLSTSNVEVVEEAHTSLVQDQMLPFRFEAEQQWTSYSISPSLHF